MDIALLYFYKFLNRILRRKSYALNYIDYKLWRYLSVSNGFFIEAGANDGLRQSNTFYFEKYQNWKGLLIEAIPALADKCRSNRPNCIVENFALVPFDFKDTHVEMRYCDLMSVVRNSMKSPDEEKQHIKSGCKIQKIETYDLKVPATTLNAILNKHMVAKIDFFSLDVEGYELAVLKGLDFDQYHPKYMLIEARYRDEIDQFLKGIYTPVAQFSHHDVLYKSKTV